MKAFLMLDFIKEIWVRKSGNWYNNALKGNKLLKVCCQKVVLFNANTVIRQHINASTKTCAFKLLRNLPQTFELISVIIFYVQINNWTRLINTEKSCFGVLKKLRDVALCAAHLLTRQNVCFFEGDPKMKFLHLFLSALRPSVRP